MYNMSEWTTHRPRVARGSGVDSCNPHNFAGNNFQHSHCNFQHSHCWPVVMEKFLVDAAWIVTTTSEVAAVASDSTVGV